LAYLFAVYLASSTYFSTYSRRNSSDRRLSSQFTQQRFQSHCQSVKHSLFGQVSSTLVVKKLTLLQLSFLNLPHTPLLDSVILTYGPMLANAFIRQVSGESTRVDLEFFNQPIKKLYTRNVNAKSWFQQAITQIPDTKADSKIKGRFLLQLGVAHSNRATKEVLTGFWSHCNGIGADYRPLAWAAGAAR
jgi:hypothetical protein